MLYDILVFLWKMKLKLEEFVLLLTIYPPFFFFFAENLIIFTKWLLSEKSINDFRPHRDLLLSYTHIEESVWVVCLSPQASAKEHCTLCGFLCENKYAFF